MCVPASSSVDMTDAQSGELRSRRCHCPPSDSISSLREALRDVAITVCLFCRARRVRARPKPDAEPVMRKVSFGGFQGVKDMMVVLD